ncbi:VOC family protein [Virgibacillus alimentarius]|uniref:VOC domain-containing protein n=1 Tax=Virgibacillus alimentarius TaxID=698769 RepID=A0ABS4SA57_9BACI|nr:MULTISPECIES: VOC family protein [Virgibacillus]MBP2258294.1 hypothetical protein [Virgibacillus alimentarius]HLR67328.1 VOC family protein [Virgibacillus sp.]
MLQLDHIVIATPDMDESISQYSSKFANKVVKGGEHEEWGTYNYLSFFSNTSYLEFINIYDFKTAKEAENPLIQHLVHVLEESKYGAFQFALRTKQLDKYITHFKKHNIPYKGPYAAERVKPDGTILKWRMLLPEYNYKDEVLPFLIEWEDPNIVFSETNLSNAKSITKIKYGGITKEEFARIYQLKPRKLDKNQLHLLNSKIFFDNDRKLRFDLA